MNVWCLFMIIFWLIILFVVFFVIYVPAIVNHLKDRSNNNDNCYTNHNNDSFDSFFKE